APAVEQLHAFGLVVDHLAQPALRFAQLARALRDRALQDLRAADLVLDVGAGAEPAHDPAIGAAQRNGAAVVPAVGAVRPAQPVLDLVALAALQGARPGGQALLPVLGVDYRLPAPSLEMRVVETGVVVAALVEEI